MDSAPQSDTTPSGAWSAAHPLTRREQNVLRRLLNRPKFRAQEIAALGLGKLQSAPGLGAKGLDNVLAWLEMHGYCLRPPPAPDNGPPERVSRRIENARHLLEQWGWRVSRPETGAAGQE